MTVRIMQSYDNLLFICKLEVSHKLDLQKSLFSLFRTVVKRVVSCSTAESLDARRNSHYRPNSFGVPAASETDHFILQKTLVNFLAVFSANVGSSKELQFFSSTVSSIVLWTEGCMNNILVAWCVVTWPLLTILRNVRKTYSCESPSGNLEHFAMIRF